MDIAVRPLDSQEPGSNSFQRIGGGHIFWWELEDDVPLLLACAEAEPRPSWQLTGWRLAAALLCWQLTGWWPTAALLCCQRCADWPPLLPFNQQSGVFVHALHVCAVSSGL
jgi:hypothetical protein